MRKHKRAKHNGHSEQCKHIQKKPTLDRQTEPGLVALYDILPGNGSVLSYSGTATGARTWPM